MCSCETDTQFASKSIAVEDTQSQEKSVWLKQSTIPWDGTNLLATEHTDFETDVQNMDLSQPHNNVFLISHKGARTW